MESKAVETKTEDAAASVEVKKDGSTASVESIPEETGVDYLEILAKQEEELDKVRTERDNYKQGLLKAKGKTASEEVEETSDLDSLIEKKVNEKLSLTKERQLAAERDALIKKMALELKETRLALKNHKVGSVSSGSNQEKAEVKTEYLSKDQINSLKARGWDDKKIEQFKKNYLDQKS